jgi:hypothetical protein
VLAPDARVVLREQLRPPAGFQLHRAVATTFTLDLTSALVAPLAFAAFETTGSSDPIAVMEAVRAAASRVDIFCQAGNVTVPRHASDLVAFLEPMVHEVVRPRPGLLFHPKVWVLHFRSDTADETFRVLCGTRNLTEDRAWDAVIRLDGAASGRAKAANRPLADLLRTLPDRARSPLPGERRAALEEFAEAIRFVEWELPEDVKEVAFHLLGVKGQRPPDFSGYRHLVVSPFLTDGGLQRITVESGDVTVVSRTDALDELAPETLDGCTTYIVSPLADLADLEAEDAGPASLTGLHAKIVVAERNKQGHLFIGSMNATDAALGGNIEVLVELIGGHSKLGVSTFLADEAPFRSLLEQYTTTGGQPSDPADEEARQLEDLIRSLAEISLVVTVVPVDNGMFELHVSGRVVTFPEAVTVDLAPFSRPAAAAPLVVKAPIDVVFSGLALADVSPFLILRATLGQLSRSTVVRGELVDDPPDRLDAVLARQVDTAEKLLRFLLLVLGFGGVDMPAAAAGNGDHTGSWGSGTTGLLELFVRSLAQRPAALDDIDRLINRLEATEAGRAILPDGFTSVWATVRSARAALPKQRAR